MVNTGKFADWCREEGGEVSRIRSGDYDYKCELLNHEFYMEEKLGIGTDDVSVRAIVELEDGLSSQPTLRFDTTIDELEGGGSEQFLEMEGENFSADIF